METSASSILWRARDNQSTDSMMRNHEERTAYTADDEHDDDMSSESSSIYSSSSGSRSSLSMSDGEVDKSDDAIPETIMVPTTIQVRTVSSDDEGDSSRFEKSKPDLRHVFESFDTSAPWMINEEEPELGYESSWSTASINTPDFLLEEDDMSLESLPVAAKLATRDFWNRIPQTG